MYKKGAMVLCSVALSGTALCVQEPEYPFYYNDEQKLYDATCSGYTDIIKIYIQTVGVTVNARSLWGDPILVGAVQCSQATRERMLKVIGLLLQCQNVEVDCRRAERFDGTTPLMEAATVGDLSAVQMLLAAGANPTLQSTKTNKTAAKFAQENNHKEVATYLNEFIPVGRKTKRALQ